MEQCENCSRVNTHQYLNEPLIEWYVFEDMEVLLCRVCAKKLDARKIDCS